MKIKFKKLSQSAVMPCKAHASDAGFDLASVEEVTIEPNSRYAINTGIAVEIPLGYYGMVLGRSGNTMRKGLVGQTGIIDTGYYDAIKVMAFNTTETPIKINIGDRVGQLIIVPHLECDFEEGDFTANNRGGGFGHSGGNVL